MIKTSPLYAEDLHDYYKDENFVSHEGVSISLWQFYNLLTGANKSTYIDSFLERAVNAADLSFGIAQHKAQTKPFWYAFPPSGLHRHFFELFCGRYGGFKRVKTFFIS